jgi:hypothetical protein
LQDKNIRKIDVKSALPPIKKLAVSNRKITDSEFPEQVYRELESNRQFIPEEYRHVIIILAVIIAGEQKFAQQVAGNQGRKLVA